MRPGSTHRFVAAMTAALATLLFGAAPAHAQDRLFAGASELGAMGHFGEPLGPAPGPVYGQFAAGGRYVVGPYSTIDTRTGEVIPTPGLAVAVDPRTPRVFVFDGTTVSTFDLLSHSVVPLVAAPSMETFGLGVKTAQLAADAGELFVWRRGVGLAPEVVVVNLATNTVARTYLIPPPGVFQAMIDWHASADGRRLAVLTSSTVQMRDGVSGDLVVQQAVDSEGYLVNRLIDDRRHQRLYVLQQRALSVFDDNLQPIANLPLRSTCAQSSLAFSHHTGRVYVMESEGGYEFYGHPIPITFYLSAFDGATGQRVATSDVTRAAGVPVGSNSCSALPLAMITAPGPPQALSAAVAGHDVALSWTNVGDASNFVLDGGIAPGRTDLTFSIGATSPVTIPNAPPGTYYLRVRGTNAFGVSRPSNEVAVVVR